VRRQDGTPDPIAARVGIEIESRDRRQAMRVVPPSQHSEVTRRFERGGVYSPQRFEAVVLRQK
jgi:hypothetical protein